jgi:hypothetical protein
MDYKNKYLKYDLNQDPSKNLNPSLNILFKTKYLKYKSKYLALKNQVGNGKYTGQINAIINRPVASVIFSIMMNDDFNIDEYKSLLDPVKEKVKDKSLYDKSGTTVFEYLKRNLDSKNPNQLKILQYFDIPIVKECSIDELMTLDNSHEVCTNFTRVKGSCSHPAFKDENNDISDDQKTKWLELLSLIKSKMDLSKSPKYLDLVIGASTLLDTDFSDKTNAYILIINPFSVFNEYDTVKSTIEGLSDLKNKKHTIKLYFPLSHNFAKSIEVLDKILQINTSDIKVRITNRMCGTCFRSMYYLVKNGVEYKVYPEQGLSDTLDTDEIKKCFK